MFCPNCGYKLDDTDMFCPSCGTAISKTSNNAPTTYINESSNNIWCKTRGIGMSIALFTGKILTSVICESLLNTGIGLVFKSGEEERKLLSGSCIILTNIELLAKKMQVSTATIKELLEAFISIKKDLGITYHLVNAGNYTYAKKGILGNKRVSLDCNSKIHEYTDILMDFKYNEINNGRETPMYLFIIGGDDIIPMPNIRNYIVYNEANKTIDTDILYTYDCGQNALTQLESKEIFKNRPEFHVGRLPFGNVATYDDLFNYLQRDINVTYGIKIEDAYSQCDPNWKNVTSKIAFHSLLGKQLRNLDGQLGDEYYYNRIMLSPMVHIDNVNQVFDTNASIYYFNLHGGNKTPFYFGAAQGTNNIYRVLSPVHIATSKEPNVIVSEACYGAQFIGLDKENSMMLSAINSCTMNFLGSSRASLGMGDGNSTSPANVSISYADIIAYSFIRTMIEDSCTMGEAIYRARKNVFSNYSASDPKAALTVVEFNLFGDPTLFMVEPGKSIDLQGKEITSYIENDDVVTSTVEEINSEKQDSSYISSLLRQVREAVDENIKQMHEKIGKHLYEFYGIKPRPADNIFRIKYGNGIEEYDFNYSITEKDAEIPINIIATTLPSGDIKRILISK